MTASETRGQAGRTGDAVGAHSSSFADLAPSIWVRRFAHLIAAGGTVLDLACGAGRHARFLAQLGYRVEAVDRDPACIAALAGVSGVAPRRADLESAPWPYAPASFDGIVVANYLYRPLFSHLLEALRPGGVLLYETFAAGNELHGRPSKPEFLLRPHELLHRLQPHLQIVAFEQGLIIRPRKAVVQRICALARATETCALAADQDPA